MKNKQVEEKKTVYNSKDLPGLICIPEWLALGPLSTCLSL